MATRQTVVNKDTTKKKLLVKREFDAPLEKVWKAWTESNLLDQWWAPKPYKAQTKSMDFKSGGTWLYCMVGPDAHQPWCRVDFKEVVPQKSFKGVSHFCDENGKIAGDFPAMEWTNLFSSNGNTTTVDVEISFSSEADMNKILEMGFEQGFSAALGNLDEMFS